MFYLYCCRRACCVTLHHFIYLPLAPLQSPTLFCLASYNIALEAFGEFGQRSLDHPQDQTSIMTPNAPTICRRMAELCNMRNLGFLVHFLSSC